jgi:transcriptional regulator with XRE-family HTH domain
MRRRRGVLTQAELAERMDVLQTTISRWELGEVDLSLKQLRLVETALDLPFGTFARDAGFLDPALVLDSEGLVSRFVAGSWHDASELVAAADTLALGVELRSLSRFDLGPDDGHEGWVILVYSDLPSDD